MTDRPAPRTMRLVRAQGGRRGPPCPPFGIASWTPDTDSSEAIAVELSPLATDVAAVLAEIPAPEDLEPETLVVVLGDPSWRPWTTTRLLARAIARVRGHGSIPLVAATRAIRASALLARGYEKIGAAPDEASGLDLVWGFTSPRRPSEGS